MVEYTTSSEAETIELGYRFGQSLPANSIVCFFGDLASGKTTFIKGLAAAQGEGAAVHVSSPTFVYLNIYEGQQTVYHFDLYRLKDANAFLSMGFDEMLFAGGICCIEWSERIASLLPPQCIHVQMAHVSENVRQITITVPNR